MEYQTIFTMKESEKATVELAAMEGHIGPVVIKRLQGANPDIYRLLCHTQNSHIPQIYAVEEQGTELFIAEEYVDGENLEEYLGKQSLSDDEKLTLALQLCEAVDFLHSMEPPVIHRDIKPSNILITGKGILKLIDFDASRQYKELQNSGDTRLLGTVEYAPPEQFGYSQTDVRSDIYSMGVVFHGLQLTGNKKRAEQWARIVEKCTSFDPKNRYQSVTELAKEIKKLQEWKRLWFRKLTVHFATFAVMVTAAVLAVTMWTKQENGSDRLGLTGTPQPTNTSIPAATPVLTIPLTPTEAVTLNTSPEPTPTAEAIPSPTLTVTLQPSNTPTSKPSYTPTPSLSPTPSPTQTPMPPLSPTPSPTQTPTPSLSPTPTPSLSPTPSPTPTPPVTIQPTVTPITKSSDYSYYQSSRSALIIPDERYENTEILDNATCFCSDTGVTMEIPLGMVEQGNGYVKVSKEFMMSLESQVYEFSFQYYGVFEESSILKRSVTIYPDDEVYVSAESKLLVQETTIYSKYSGFLTNVICNGESSRITEVYVLNRDSERTDVEENWCGYDMAGQVIRIAGEYFMRYYDQGPLTLCFVFDDGSVEQMKINFVDGMPDIPEYFEGMGGILRGAPIYYKSVSKGLNQVYGHNMVNPELVQAECYNHITKETQEIPIDKLDVGTGYVGISEGYMSLLKPSIYEFSFTFEDGFKMNRYVQVYRECITPKWIGNSKFQFWDKSLESHEPGLAAALNNITTCKLTGVSISTDEEEKVVDPEWYEISCDGRFIMVDREFLLPYLEKGKVTLIYWLDDGSSREVVVSYDGQATLTPTPSPSPTATPSPTPVTELLPVPETINQHYYPGLVEETELILRHGWSSGQKPSEWYGTCYNYTDGTTVMVSQNMIDIGDGYIRILDDFLLTLEPSTYELTLYFHFEPSGSMKSTDRTLQVYTESAMPGSSGGQFSRSKDKFQVNNPQNFMNNIRSSSTSRFTGVAVQTEGMGWETVEEEWYEILCDGKVLILKKEYLLQYAEEENLTLIYFFDDGKQQELELTYEGNDDDE